MQRPHPAPAAAASVAERIDHVVEQAKPHLRGWLHVGMVPVSVVLSLVLALLVPTTAGRVAATVFGVTAVLLFATSATYHRGRWSPRVAGVLKRMDHANIFLIIAGTYTPFAVLLLPEGQQRTLLWVVWAGAVAGVVFRVFWVRAPRWLYTVVYVALGWVAVFYLVPFWRTGGPAVVVLMMLGGIMYTVGAVVYALKRPDPSPRWFGFHEVFHAFTIAGFSAHWAAVLVAVLGVRAALA